MSSVKRKVDLYVLSLALLFIFLIIITFERPEGSICLLKTDCWLNFFSLNKVSIIATLFLIYCIYSYAVFDNDLKGSTNIPFEVTKVENLNFEHLTFLATYIVPLISFDFESFRQLLVLALLLVVMGVIYVKTDLFYANPSLALIGFHIYRADGNFKNNESRNSIVLISKSKIKKGQKLKYIKLDEKVYYVTGG
ncbi:MAG: hypothetical protein HUJ16_11330 [Kangiella sp.]|nr:hypothetical protein [Kangiella sp.]